MEGSLPSNFGEARPWANHKSVLLGLPISFLVRHLCDLLRMLSAPHTFEISS